jgi:hypothetical protein
MIFRQISKGLLLIVLAGALGFSIWTWAALEFVYSTGERAGYIQKFSKRGWLFKTWEGEMAMVNLPGTMPEKFYFSVRDDSIAERIKETLGHRIVLKYNQHRGLPPRIFGDTSYFIIEVRLVEGSEEPGPIPTAI